MKSWFDSFRQELGNRLTLWIFSIAALHILVGAILARVYGWPLEIHTLMYSKALHWAVIWFTLGIVSWRSFYIMIAIRPKRLTLTILEDLRRICLNPQRLARGIPIVLLFSIMFSVFTSYKSLIPEIVPFKYDELFSQIDRTLHFGVDPWRILFPVLSVGIMVSVLSFFYKIWFVAKFSVLFWQAFSLKRPRLREQFFLTYILVWIINGTIFALLFSSVGPCFYGNVVDGPNPYAALMEFLRETNKTMPVWDLVAQDYLWYAYESKEILRFSGISAMPSLHVSLAFLFVLLGWGTGRKTGILFTVYFLLVMMGSVFLGWHYAIDGYFAIITTSIIWLSVGRFIKWVDARATARQLVESPVQA